MVVGSLLVALGALTGSGVAPSAAEQHTPALAQAAAREAELNWIDCVAGPDTARALADRFRALYGLPQTFRVNHSLQASARLTSLILEEARAGRVTFDVATCAVPELFYELLRRGELARYESPEYRYYAPSKAAGLTHEPGYWLSPWAYTFVVAWNPKFVPEEIVSWRDVLNPKYKGKIVMGDPLRSPTYTNAYIGLRKVLDIGFFQQLADLKPFFLVRSEDIMARVISGEFPIAFFGMPTRAYQAAQKGVEIRVAYPREGVVLLGTPWVILAKAPHPNAARLWIDFIFGKIGHEIYITHEALSTGREDLPVPSLLRKYTPPVAETRSLPMDWKGLTDEMRKAARAEFQETFGR